MSYALKFLKTKAITVSKLSRTAFIVERSAKQSVLASLNGGSDAMTDFINKRKLIEKETLENTSNSLKSLDVNTSKEDLVKISYIIYSDAELNTMLEQYKKIYQNDTRSWSLIGENLVRTLINLENTKRLLDLFRRNEYRFMFLNTRCYDILFNKIYQEERYLDVVNLFEESIAFYRRSSKSTGSKIPTRHLEMVTSSLIKLNSDKALERAKQIVQRVNTNQSKFSDLSIVQLCTLALNQGDFTFADQNVLQALAPKNNSGIFSNLKAIVQSNSDLAKSLNTLEAIVKKTDSNDRILLASVLDRIEKVIEDGSSENKASLQERLTALRQKAIDGDFLVVEKLNQICSTPELITKYIQPTPNSPTDSYEIGTIKMLDNSTGSSESKQSVAKEAKKSSSGPTSQSSQPSAIKLIEPWSQLTDHLNRLHAAGQHTLVVDTYLLNLRTRLEKEGKPSEAERQKETENLTLVTRSLLARNTVSCLKRLNKLSNLINAAELELSLDSRIHIFLLNIQQNEPSSALGYLNMFDLEKTALPLYRNLKAVCYSNLNDFGNALDILDDIKTKKKNKFTKEGFVFPFTLRAVQTRMENEPEDSPRRRRFDQILKVLKSEDRISVEDIHDLFDLSTPSKGDGKEQNEAPKTPTPSGSDHSIKMVRSPSLPSDDRRKQPNKSQANRPPRGNSVETFQKLKEEIAETRKRIFGENPALSKSESAVAAAANNEEALKKVFEDLDKAFVNERYDKFIHEFHVRLAYKSKKTNFYKQLVASYLPYMAKSFLLAKETELEKMKKIISLLKSQGLDLDPVSMINVFLAIVLHKDPLFALETLVDLDTNQVFKKNFPSVHNNLLVIGFVMINQVPLAFEKVEAILNCEPNNSDRYDGIIFPFTLNCLKELANYSKEGDQEILKTIDLIEGKCIQENRLSSKDLSELVNL